ncbi:MAG: hypothetical protein Q4F63_02065 [Clostridia bacterium]|nr:hypothetical protein [Clostridia bacterium]
MKYQIILSACLWVFLLLSIICLIVMIIELFGKGDERRKFILFKTSLNTAKIYVVLLLAGFIYNIFIEKYTKFEFECTPVIYLCILSFIFTGILFINKKRYG